MKNKKIIKILLFIMLGLCVAVLLYFVLVLLLLGGIE